MFHQLKVLNIAVLAASLSLIVAANTAWSDDTQTQAAKDAFAQGKTHFEAGEFDKAAASFRSAYDLNPSWKLQYNIGQAEASAKRYGLALEAFENYLAGGGDEISEERRDEVQGELNRLRTLVGSLDITAPKGAEIFVDGILRGVAPLPGIIKISAAIPQELKVTYNQMVLETRTVKVSVGDTLRVLVETPKDAAGVAIPLVVAGSAPDEAAPAGEKIAEEPAQPVAQESKKKNPARALKIAGWVSAGVGVAVIGGGVALGAMALSLDGEIADSCATDPMCATNNQADIDQSWSYATGSTIMLAAGGAIAATGIALIIVGYVKDSKADVAVTPILGDGLAGAALTGRF